MIDNPIHLAARTDAIAAFHEENKLWDDADPNCIPLSVGYAIHRYLQAFLNDADVIESLAKAYYGDRHIPWEDAGKTARNEYMRKGRNAAAALRKLCEVEK